MTPSRTTATAIVGAFRAGQESGAGSRRTFRSQDFPARRRACKRRRRTRKGAIRGSNEDLRSRLSNSARRKPPALTARCARARCFFRIWRRDNSVLQNARFDAIVERSVVGPASAWVSVSALGCRTGRRAAGRRARVSPARRRATAPSRCRARSIPSRSAGRRRGCTCGRPPVPRALHGAPR